MPKFIITTGGVVSGLGKGVATATIGKLLSSDYKIIPIKCDGYLNVDPGTMNPIEHGEVYVLDDGAEVDMDFGHYERYLGVSCKKDWNLTMGKVFSQINKSERRGDFLGKTVMMVPHVTDMIEAWWLNVANKEKADIVLIEIGGTVGDMENELYIEAARRLRNKLGRNNTFFVHLTYVPVLFGTGEQKSKPTQQSINLLRERGIIPDMIVGRCSEPLAESIKEKIAIYADIDKSQVVTGVDTDNVYKMPLLFKEEGVAKVIAEKLGLELKDDLKDYEKFIDNMDNSDKKIRVAICGKYTGLADSYASVVSALRIAGALEGMRTEYELIETTDIENGLVEVDELLKDFNGVIVPGGFGARGAEGKIEVIRYCRENNIPYLGLCYGLQLAVVEFARNVCGMEEANSAEINDESKFKVIDILPDKKNVKNMGGTLRLGSYKAKLKKGSRVSELYGSSEASERHRHRYEVNPEYHKSLVENGLVFGGLSPDGNLVEFIENPKCDFFVATQAHPEFKTPSPLFVGFVNACLDGK